MFWLSSFLSWIRGSGALTVSLQTQVDLLRQDDSDEEGDDKSSLRILNVTCITKSLGIARGSKNWCRNRINGDELPHICGEKNTFFVCLLPSAKYDFRCFILGWMDVTMVISWCFSLGIATIGVSAVPNVMGNTVFLLRGSINSNTFVEINEHAESAPKGSNSEQRHICLGCKWQMKV